MPDSSTRPIDVLGYGVAATDEVIELDRYPEPDVKVDLRAHDTQAGGICVNALAGAVKLGLKCHYVGPLGRNPLSDIVRAGMDAAGITYAPPVDDDGAGPSHAFILVDRSTGSRTILMDKSRVREMPPHALSDELLASTRALYVDAWRLDAGLSAVQRARAQGVIVIADLEEHEPERVSRLLPFIDHLIVPQGYAMRLTDTTSAEDAVRALASSERPCTAVTCGEAGSYFIEPHDPTALRHQSAYDVPVVDTTGCGDAFHGAYIAAILNGRSVAGAMRYASAAAALNARGIGAQAGLPRHEEIVELVELTPTRA